jgi:hypothetical protein
VTALPIPLLIYFAPSWSWIVVATLLLGVNQGFTWSMTQTAKLDLTRPDQRALIPFPDKEADNRVRVNM